jgi:hypothetical protein
MTSCPEEVILINYSRYIKAYCYTGTELGYYGNYMNPYFNELLAYNTFVQGYINYILEK